MHLLLALGLLSTPSAKEASEGPWLNALRAQFTVTAVAEGDINGDGARESVVCYKDSPRREKPSGGVAILGDDGRRALFHARFSRGHCTKPKPRKGALDLLVVEKGAEGGTKLAWKYDKDFGFPGSAAHPLTGVKVSASTTLDKPRPFPPAAAFDSKLDTTWAEGAEGTGIGETILVRFEKPLFISAVGVFGGNSTGARIYADHNRLHRASFDARTDADLGDEAAGIDFSALGIGVIGDRVEYSVRDEPLVHFVHLDKEKVRELELRIDSVYLGNRYDDTHIAEIDIIPLIKVP